MFYVLLALRAELRARGAFDGRQRSRSSTRCSTSSRSARSPTSCKLDANNRRLVAQGLKRIRAGALQPGIAALFAAAGGATRGGERLRLRLRARAAHQCRRAGSPT